MAEGVDELPEHSFVGPENHPCEALFEGTRGNTWQCGLHQRNKIHTETAVKANEPIPQHEFQEGDGTSIFCQAKFYNEAVNETFRCAQLRSNDIHLVEVDEPVPVGPQEATGLDEHDTFTIPVDAALSIELRKLEQQLDSDAMRINAVPTQHCRQEAKRIIHTSMRLAAIAWALEEGRLQIHPRTIDHQVAQAAWEMDQQIATTEDGHAH